MSHNHPKAFTPLGTICVWMAAIRRPTKNTTKLFFFLLFIEKKEKLVETNFSVIKLI